MDNIRFRALEISIQHKRKPVEYPEGKSIGLFRGIDFQPVCHEEVPSGGDYSPGDKFD